MKHSKLYGFALIVGTLCGAITMLFHPTGRDLIGQPDEIAHRYELITVAVHSLAIFGLPVMFFGFLGFSRRLGLENPLVSAALIAYGFGAIAVMSAAVINGLVGPVLTGKINEADEPTRKLFHLMLMNNSLLNQAFTKVFVAAVGFALITWSIHLWNKGRLMQISAILGFVVGILSWSGIFSGHLKLDVHGFGLFTFAQSIWTLLVAVFMIRTENKESDIISQEI
jgi:hypothetical protein